MKTNYEKLMKINYEKLLIFYLPFTKDGFWIASFLAMTRSGSGGKAQPRRGVGQ